MKCYESTMEEINHFSQQVWEQWDRKHTKVTPEVGYSPAKQGKLNAQNW